MQYVCDGDVFSSFLTSLYFLLMMWVWFTVLILYRLECTCIIISLGMEEAVVCSIP